MNNIDTLLSLTTRLKGLLEKPEPGLFSWHDAVHNLIKQISEFA